MKRIIILLSLVSYSGWGLAQINTADSTAQVITYWDKGEKQHYTISVEKLKIKDTDTTSRELTKYEVEVSVLDATEKSYTIEWTYKNISTNNTNETLKKIMSISQNMKVIFKTDEMGSFIEVVNWREIKDFIHNSLNAVKKDFNNIPEMQNIFNQLESMYTSKEAIESNAIKDIHQFHTFHGGKYKLGEVLEGTLKVPNLFGKEPFDSYYSVYLDEINTEDSNFILRSVQQVDKEQLTNATFQYLTDMAKNMKVTPPKREDLKDLANETQTASRIHNTGWVIYSIQTTTVTSDNITSIEERVIEIE